jgi:predicted esterase
MGGSATIKGKQLAKERYPMRNRLCLSLALLPLALLAIVGVPALGQGRKEGVIIFKDGFVLTGQVKEKRDYIIDPIAGQSITIPKSGALTNLDDRVRRMYFAPGQVADVQPRDPDRGFVDLKRFANTSLPLKILPGWQVVSATPWNNKWERTLKIYAPETKAYIFMDQRIVQANPRFLHVQTLKYDWDLYHLTRELSVDELRKLLTDYFADKKDLKDWDRRKGIALFLHQAGWHKEAQKELDNLAEEYPSRKDELAGVRDTIKKVLADIYVDDIDRAAKVGQHDEAQHWLAIFAKENMAPLVSEKNLLRAEDLKGHYAAQNEKIAQLKTLLKSLPQRVPPAARPAWVKPAQVMEEELNHDTLARLETFLTLGQQYEREIEAQKTPSQSAEEVLALAVSGWLLGNSSAAPEVKNALLLWRARDMVLEYQKTDNTRTRGQMLQSVLQAGKLPLDVLARLIKNLPPPQAYDKTQMSSQPVKLEIDIADSKGGSYYFQLPPDYHHNRPHPVLLLLHGQREKADGMMERVSELAAQHGFVLAAPLWGGAGPGAAYTYSAREHAIVLDTLRDLRRRFQIDSDRVFLLGWEQGANAALDIGMSHPDQFAGVLSMCGAPRYYTGERDRYLTNAQYLPFYIVDGDRDGANPKVIQSLLKEWVKSSYPSIYVEYKGRGPEWYSGELPRMFDWMTRKKRYHPAREMGRRHTGGGIGEEFRTMRASDNRFYWLSTDEIDPRHLNDPARWVPGIQPASMLAYISVSNETITKGGQKEARIYTQVNVQTKGLRQISVWLAPHMVDFTKPVRVRVNGSSLGGDRVIIPDPSVLMEDFFYNGDRQRLFFARVDLRFPG